MRGRTDNLNVLADCTGDPLEHGDYCWVRFEVEDDWTVANLFLIAGVANWYGTGYGIPLPICEIGPRIMPPNL